MPKLDYLCNGIPLRPLPEIKPLDQNIGHAPNRVHKLNNEKKKLSIKNALRYFPKEFHDLLAKEFKNELEVYGHIYMFRFVPDIPPVETLNFTDFPAKNIQCACIMLQICNNLSYSVAQFPQELVIYGGNGQCFSNWAQFYLTLNYLSNLELHETLILNSGHPLGTFPNQVKELSKNSPKEDVKEIWKKTLADLKNNLKPSQRQKKTLLQISNGICIPNYSSNLHYNDYFALGVSSYGQMTAGSFCYIGPQGIVHGTAITLMSAASMFCSNYLSHFTSFEDKIVKVENSDSICISDKISYPFSKKHIIHKNCKQNIEKSSTKIAPVYLSSGLGGMSGAQPKASLIANVISITAEINYEPLIKRFNQGWLNEIITDLKTLVERIRYVKKNNIVTSIGYFGNIVEIWEELVELYKKNQEILIDLASDQTSCHNISNGGYLPIGLNYEQSSKLITKDPKKFSELVKDTLVKHVNSINFLTEKTNLKFWDYGNAFLLEACKAGADLIKNSDVVNGTITELNLINLKLKYQSYFESIMGDIFSLGFGPFRWICSSNSEKDLEISDSIAMKVLEKEYEKSRTQISELSNSSNQYVKVPDNLISRQFQLRNNLKWIKEAKSHNLVVGCKSRILYCDKNGRREIALEFNKAIREGLFEGPIVLSRDHHDVSSVDSPFRETSNVDDGSKFTADMAVQNAIGLCQRNATWVAIHNGGGVGFGQSINGGFGLVLDGTKTIDNTIKVLMEWDVNNGISRRAWAGNSNAYNTILDEKKNDNLIKITMREEVEKEIIEKLY